MAAQKHSIARRRPEATVAGLFEVWQDRHAATVAAGWDDDLYAANLEIAAIDRLLDAPARTLADFAAKIAAVTEMGADPDALSGTWGKKIAAEAMRLLTGAWAEAAARIAAPTRPPVAAHRIGSDLADAEGRFHEIYGIAPDGAVLVRPDGYVGWRSEGAAADPAGTLAGALDRICGRAA